jgi:hypothetical protein
LTYSNVTTNARAQASRLTGIPVSNIVICATHSHTGPLFDDTRRYYFNQAAVEQYGKDPHEQIYFPDFLTERLVKAIHASPAFWKFCRIASARDIHPVPEYVHFAFWFDGPSPSDGVTPSQFSPVIKTLRIDVGHYTSEVASMSDSWHAGSKEIEVPLVQMNALLGFVSDALLATILGLGLDEETQAYLGRQMRLRLDESVDEQSPGPANAAQDEYDGASGPAPPSRESYGG